jgi:hypothetical protein
MYCPGTGTIRHLSPSQRMVYLTKVSFRRLSELPPPPLLAVQIVPAEGHDDIVRDTNQIRLCTALLAGIHVPVPSSYKQE